MRRTTRSTRATSRLPSPGSAHTTVLEGKRVVLGVSGGIAAYKAIEVCRRLVDAGAHVVPVLTEGALHFVGRTTFDALGSERAWTSLWDEDRPSAIARLIRALHELQIGGVKTTRPLHLALAGDPAVGRADFHTRWLEGWLEANAPKLAAE